jgi:E3 SUMO-protein ligase NSE2
MPAHPAFQAQPQETVLNAQGQQALRELLQAQAARKRLQHRLDSAVKRLTYTAGQLNDRASDQRIEHEKTRRGLEEKGEEVDDEQDQTDNFQRKVNDLTEKMDQGIRNVIDSRTWLDGVSQALRHVSSRTDELIDANQRHLQRSRRRAEGIADGQDGEDSQNGGEEAAGDQLSSSDAPSALLRDSLSRINDVWTSKTPTDRYANNNDYTGFYRTVFDAKNPGEDAPPVPHASLWFAEEEGRERQLKQNSQDQSGTSAGDEDSDLEVASERIRTKCPITFLTFKDPWKSKKCPHSFEKEAIMDMIDKSTNYLPFTPAQLQELNAINPRRPDLRARRAKEIGTPQVGCPECDVKITMDDLAPNPILLRKVTRILEAERRQREAEEGEDEDEDEEDVPRGTQRRAVLELSPARSTSMKMENVKSVQAKQRYQQPQRRSHTVESTTVVGLGDSQDEDEEMYDG